EAGVDRTRDGGAGGKWHGADRLGGGDEDPQVEKRRYERRDAHKDRGEDDRRGPGAPSLADPDRGHPRQRRQSEGTQRATREQIRREPAQESPPDRLAGTGSDRPRSSDQYR